MKTLICSQTISTHSLQFADKKSKTQQQHSFPHGHKAPR